MRVRIAFRKYGTEVTDETLAEAAQLLRQARRAKAPEPEGLQLTRADVLEAMDRGDEILNIILLKPVSFDMEFHEHTITAQIRPTKHRPSTSNPKIKKPSTHKVYDDVQSASNSGLPKSLRRSARRSNALTSYAESASEEEDCEAAQDNESDFIAEPSPGDL
ncbi:hypothetical protein OF83DRAFT_454403 [Amylostereum chailletii]|nr:hypothetical protein OF83DRAFT_454403 [Amylostereum chailletii]